MIGLLASLVGGKGGRLLGGAIGGRTGSMIGGMAGALIGGRKLSGLMKGAKNKFAGGDDNGEKLNDKEAEILIKLMVNAAKADGEIDQVEKDAILNNLGEVSEGEKQFLNSEIEKPFIAPSDLGKGIDRGLSADAYVISLMAIKVDTDQETSYLRELSNALGIDENQRNDIHDQLEVDRI